ncbi:MAG TPA: hypothetical protein VI755_09325 [Anaerolineales bacterium]|nr:hypothetical protein [Anaerolineales bacterium]
MKINRINTEHGLFLLAVALALALRLLRLGAGPLSDYEAEWALRALQVSRGEQSVLGPGPGYALLTGAIFFLFGNSNAMARLWPALVGSAVIFLPYILRKQLGRPAALAIAFGLAMDPGLVTASRLVGGPMLSVGFGLLAIACGIARKPALAGFFAGLALLSGPAILHGLIGLAIAGGMGTLLVRRGFWDQEWVSEIGVDRSDAVRTILLAGGGAILIAGTLFLRFPEGLGGLAGTVPDYLAGWVNPSEIPASRLIAALIVYQPLVLVFATIAVVRAWRESVLLPRWLSLWAMSALVLVLIYPGRQVSDLAWVLVPMWALAGLEIARYFSFEEKITFPALGQAALIFLMLTLAWLNLVSMSQSGGDEQIYRLRWVVIVGTLALGAVTTLLVGLGWSLEVARRGLFFGLIAGLGLYGLAGMWNASQLHPNGEQELWSPYPATQQAEEFLITLGDLSEWHSTIRDELDVAVVKPTPSLQWILRNWKGARFLSSPVSGELPSVIINSGDQSSPSLSVPYRGQDFAWWVYPAWGGALPPDWPRWLVFRDAPQQKEHIIMWVRGDLFPGGSLAPPEEPATGKEEVVPEDSPVR